MKTTFKNWLLPVWLFACLSVAQITFGQWVLCVEDDGSVSIEMGLCACHSMSKVVAEVVFMDNAETHRCGPCKDITTEIDTLRMAAPVRPFHHLLPIVITHPEAKKQHFDLVFSQNDLPISPYPHVIHPTISTTILLI